MRLNNTQAERLSQIDIHERNLELRHRLTTNYPDIITVSITILDCLSFVLERQGHRYSRSVSFEGIYNY